MIVDFIQIAIEELQKIKCDCTCYKQGKCDRCDIIEELIRLRIRVYELLR